jgi:hypothetical protein
MGKTQVGICGGCGKVIGITESPDPVLGYCDNCVDKMPKSVDPIDEKIRIAVDKAVAATTK